MSYSNVQLRFSMRHMLFVCFFFVFFFGGGGGFGAHDKSCSTGLDERTLVCRAQMFEAILALRYRKTVLLHVK